MLVDEHVEPRIAPDITLQVLLGDGLLRVVEGLAEPDEVLIVVRVKMITRSAWGARSLLRAVCAEL